MLARTAFTITLLAVIALGCTAGSTRIPQSSNRLSRLVWLLGTWEATGSKSNTVESWTMDSTGSLIGATYKVVNGDTTISETTQLVEDYTGVYFVASVPHNRSEVRFRLERLDHSGAHFTNAKHDYPTSVHYRPAGADSIYAWIEGKTDGKTHRIEYRYRKVR